ncbi:MULTISPECIES: bestrophin family protein [Sphingobium]|jgi:putative membrane protein|uniref:bestrophin family protein n=1 Tax=Sphingobium TaxID=165695 RepID=UPI000DBAFA74|nr:MULTISPECIES: bestrophin family protein [Sphingobium]KAA9012207.1 bestrophin [Sphingobium limneticum]MBU0932642.1 bestrophin family protein [Alphaproteobacteria bacterium]BBD00821.1 putative membrane protein [Sphingobium sp. YG1]
MIVRPRPGLMDVAFALRGSVLPRIKGRLALITVLSVAAVMTARLHPGIFSQISAIPFTLMGIALSVFMSFRNNACYDRWWEGRKLWGSLIIACRSLARRTTILEMADRRLVLTGLCGFTAGLAARLRGADERAAIARHAGEGPWLGAVNPADALLQHLGRHCLLLMQDGRIGAIHHSLLEEQLHLLAQVQAGCERIQLTPLPFSYSLLLHRTATIFCLTLPFALAGALGWWTLLPAVLVSYTFFGLDALGDQLEDPFGLEPNDLPIDAMTRTVEREMLSALGETILPPPIEAKANILT